MSNESDVETLKSEFKLPIDKLEQFKRRYDFNGFEKPFLLVIDEHIVSRSSRVKSKYMIVVTVNPRSTLSLRNYIAWLSQEQISRLFARERSVATTDIGNVFKEGKLHEESNVQILHIAGADRPTKFYNLVVLIQ